MAEVRGKSALYTGEETRNQEPERKMEPSKLLLGFIRFQRDPAGFQNRMDTPNLLAQSDSWKPRCFALRAVQKWKRTPEIALLSVARPLRIILVVLAIFTANFQLDSLWDECFPLAFFSIVIANSESSSSMSIFTRARELSIKSNVPPYHQRPSKQTLANPKQAAISSSRSWWR